MVLNNTPGSTDPISGAVAIGKDATAQLLRDILSQCKTQIVVFDLDSTLLNNRPRSALIMREFAAEQDIPALTKAAPEHFPTWSAHNSLRLLGFSDTEAKAVVDDYLDFWAPRFFSSEYCRQDIPIHRSVEFVNAVHQAGGIVTYLTGRDESMRSGTLASLSEHGFVVPGIGDVSLIMKAEIELSDDEYKLQTMKKIADMATVKAAFDNEPTHINTYREVFPDSYCVHLHTDHSMRQVRLLPGIPSIRDFEH